ncbi:MAG: cytochrome c-type biogenesis protein CcmH [Alphaproteobacteria bacterium]|nr:cytochrome c-type biogenesis protein CcmH [Alphaproteobacteria bacterium]
MRTIVKKAKGKMSAFIKKKELLLLLLFFSFPVFAENSIERRAHALYKEVRCPECAAQSIAESETPQSKALRGFIVEQLEEGKSDETIRDELGTLFGEDILFRSSFDSNPLFSWLFSFVLLLGIILLFFWKGYQSRAK